MNNEYLTSRRRFLKQTSIGLGLAGLALGGDSSGAAEEGAGGISIITPDNDAITSGAPAQWALTQLKQALESQGAKVRLVSSVSQAPAGDVVIVAASSGHAVAREVIGGAAITLPSAAETLALVPGTVSGRPVVLVSGNDVRGMLYAILELTDRVLYSEALPAALKVSSAIIEKPHNKTRSMCRSFQSEVEDKSWFNDRQFWREYLSMLAAERFNRFNLCLGLHYNSTPAGSPEVYLFFAYPFLVSLPEYREVSAKNLPDAERDANLQMLKFIGEECARRGLEFQLGLWSHAYAYGAGANYPIQGLTAANHAPYCRDALTALLKACPQITGVTFRVHNESGIPTGSYGFWKTLFEAFPRAGRMLEIDMHGKECHQEHIDAAAATGMRVVVSPKYVSEHQGLPYHEASLRESERSRNRDTTVLNGQASRYGYANFLKENRNFGVLHRIWPGTQRLLLWGDPVFAAGFGRASSFCDSVGVEWNEPLSFKGREGSGTPGGRCGYLDATLNPTYDYQKFLYTYRVWGRLLYNPDTDPQSWRRYLAKEFGAAAQQPVEEALGNASRILPLVTMYHAVGVANQVYWPEIYTNISIVAGGANLSDNRTTTGASSSFDPQLFLRIDDYVERLLAGTAFDQHKYFPTEVAQWLEDWANAAASNLAKAKKLAVKPIDPSFRRLEADVAIQSGLGLFFARKFRSAMLWAIYQKTGDVNAKTAALAQYNSALKAWSDLVDVATPIYKNDLTYGRGTRLRGHWKDRVAAIKADIAAMEKGDVVGTPTHAGPAAEAIATVQSRPTRPSANCRHTEPGTFVAGKDLTLTLAAEGTDISDMKLYYRHVNQADAWQVLPMQTANGSFQATIPGSYTQSQFPLQYYFGMTKGNQGSALFPGFDASLANQPYFVARLKWAPRPNAKNAKASEPMLCRARTVNNCAASSYVSSVAIL